MIRRRTALAAAAGAAALPSVGLARAASPVFVLVHGAWHGGWCWRKVRQRLEAEGARVFTPTLTGLGERAHLFTPELGLDVHIRDVAAVIEAEELAGVILCGHSYAGMVVTGVCDRLKPRLGHVVYLDAALPRHGQSMVTQHPRPERDAMGEAGARAYARDGRMPAPPDVTLFGLPSTGADADWVRRRLTPMPLKPWLDPIVLHNGGSDGMARTYVHCTRPALAASFAFHAERLRRETSWRYLELATGHDAMITAPAETAAVLLEAAALTGRARPG